MSKPENPVPGYKHLLIEPYTPSHRCGGARF
jgi:hypothetical protein